MAGIFTDFPFRKGFVPPLSGALWIFFLFLPRHVNVRIATVVVYFLQDPIQSCARGGRRIVVVYYCSTYYKAVRVGGGG